MSNDEIILTVKEMDAIKFKVKLELRGENLPFLPELIEEMLFMQGRDAWTYKFSEFEVACNGESKSIAFNIGALLKKEFHKFAKQHRYKFAVKCICSTADNKVKITNVREVQRS